MKVEWITPGIVIAAFPAMGYAVAFAYEYGFCNVFRIPPYFIEVSLTSVLIAVFSLVIFLGGAFVIWYVYVFKPIQKAPRPMRQSLSVLAGGLLVVILLMLIYRDIWLEWIWLLVAVVMMWAIYYLSPILLKLIKNVLGLAKKGSARIVKYLIGKGTAKTTAATDSVIESEEINASKSGGKVPVQEPTTSADFARNSTLRKVVFGFIVVIILILWTSLILGEATAKRQERFLTIPTPQESVVLRIYGKNMICAPFDREKVKIAGNIFVLSKDSVTNLVLTLEHIGRLAGK